MKISVICPLYNGEDYIKSLNASLLKQKNVEFASIEYILTEGKDNSEEVLKSLNCNYKKITPKEFSHSRTREEAAFRAKGDILVFITQDIIICDDLWLSKLVKPIIEGQCSAAFSRQICDNNTIEKYIREKNYPEESRIISAEDIDKLGIKTFFFSDAASAIKREVFYELKGYDNKHLVTNEDMYIAYKMITNGYKIRYTSEAEVVHSHIFTLKQLYKRYYDTGIFLGQNDYLLEHKANQAGMGLFGYVVKRALEEKNIPVLISSVPNFAARYLGNFFGKRVGKKEKN